MLRHPTHSPLRGGVGVSAETAAENDRDELGAALLDGREIRIAGVLLDMDGTLVDSVPAVEESWRIMAQEFGVPSLPATLHGQTAEAVVAAAGVPRDQHARAISRLVEVESRPGQRLKALPGVRPFITSLPAGRWGVVTSAPRPVAHARYGATGLTAPEFFVTGDDVTASKPDPQPFGKGLAELGRRGVAGVVMAVEDSIAGVRSARGAGCLAVGVVGTCTAAELAPHAHLVIESFDQFRITSRATGISLAMARS